MGILHVTHSHGVMSVLLLFLLAFTLTLGSQPAIVSDENNEFASAQPHRRSTARTWSIADLNSVTALAMFHEHMHAPHTAALRSANCGLTEFGFSHSGYSGRVMPVVWFGVRVGITCDWDHEYVQGSVFMILVDGSLYFISPAPITEDTILEFPIWNEFKATHVEVRLVVLQRQTQRQTQNHGLGTLPVKDELELDDQSVKRELEGEGIESIEMVDSEGPGFDSEFGNVQGKQGNVSAWYIVALATNVVAAPPVGKPPQGTLAYFMKEQTIAAATASGADSDSELDTESGSVSDLTPWLPVLSGGGVMDLDDLVCVTDAELQTTPFMLPGKVVAAVRRGCSALPSYGVYTALKSCSNLHTMPVTHFERHFDYPKIEPTCFHDYFIGADGYPNDSNDHHDVTPVELRRKDGVCAVTLASSDNAAIALTLNTMLSLLASDRRIDEAIDNAWSELQRQRKHRQRTAYDDGDGDGSDGETLSQRESSHLPPRCSRFELVCPAEAPHCSRLIGRVTASSSRLRDAHWHWHSDTDTVTDTVKSKLVQPELSTATASGTKADRDDSDHDASGLGHGATMMRGLTDWTASEPPLAAAGPSLDTGVTSESLLRVYAEHHLRVQLELQESISTVNSTILVPAGFIATANISKSTSADHHDGTIDIATNYWPHVQPELHHAGSDQESVTTRTSTSNHIDLDTVNAQARLEAQGSWFLRSDWRRMPKATSVHRYLCTIDASSGYTPFNPTIIVDSDADRAGASMTSAETVTATTRKTATAPGHGPVTLSSLNLPLSRADQDIAVSDLLVVLDTSISHVTLLLNTVLSLYKLGFRTFLPVALDLESYNLLRSIGFDRTIYPHAATMEARHLLEKGGCDPFLVSEMYVRGQFAHELIGHGVPFFHADSDTVWLKDPSVPIRQRLGDCRARDADADADRDWCDVDVDGARGIQMMTHFDRQERVPFHYAYRFWPEEPQLAATINNGMELYAPTLQLQEFWHDFFHDAVLPSVCRSSFLQTSMNQYAYRQGVHPRQDPMSPGEYTAVARGVGMRFFTQQWDLRNGSGPLDFEPIVVHPFGDFGGSTAVQRADAKATAMRRNGVWLLSDRWRTIARRFYHEKVNSDLQSSLNVNHDSDSDSNSRTTSASPQSNNSETKPDSESRHSISETEEPGPSVHSESSVSLSRLERFIAAVSDLRDSTTTLPLIDLKRVQVSYDDEEAHDQLQAVSESSFDRYHHDLESDSDQSGMTRTSNTADTGRHGHLDSVAGAAASAATTVTSTALLSIEVFLPSSTLDVLQSHWSQLQSDRESTCTSSDDSSSLQNCGDSESSLTMQLHIDGVAIDTMPLEGISSLSTKHDDDGNAIQGWAWLQGDVDIDFVPIATQQPETSGPSTSTSTRTSTALPSSLSQREVQVLVFRGARPIAASMPILDSSQARAQPQGAQAGK